MRHPASSRRVSLLTTMQKTLNLAVESMCLNQDATMVAKEVEAAMVVELVRLPERLKNWNLKSPF